MNVPLALRRTGRPGALVGAVAACIGLVAGGTTGCDTAQLPNGAALAISPPESTITVVERRDADQRCVIDPDHHADLPFVVALRDAQGSPIGGAEVGVQLTFTENYYSGYPVLALYEDLNGNGVVDADTELASGAEDGLARVTTSRYGGEHLLLVRMNLSCAFRAQMHAFVDGVSASAAIEVRAEEDGSAPPGERT